MYFFGELFVILSIVERNPYHNQRDYYTILSSFSGYGYKRLIL